jgi:hypothetical protein
MGYLTLATLAAGTLAVAFSLMFLGIESRDLDEERTVGEQTPDHLAP